MKTRGFVMEGKNLYSGFHTESKFCGMAYPSRSRMRNRAKPPQAGSPLGFLNVRLAVRESNQVGFDEQIFPIPLSFPLDILPICPAGKAFGLKKSAASKLLAPESECIFDGFW